MSMMIMAVVGMAAATFNHEHLDSSREVVENPSLDQQWLELINERKMGARLHEGSNDDSTGSDSDGEELPRSAMAAARGSAHVFARLFTKRGPVTWADGSEEPKLDPTAVSFLEPKLIDRSDVDPVSAEFGYNHDASTSAAWGNSSETVIWSVDMEEQ